MAELGPWCAVDVHAVQVRVRAEHKWGQSDVVCMVVLSCPRAGIGILHGSDVARPDLHSAIRKLYEQDNVHALVSEDDTRRSDRGAERPRHLSEVL